MVRKHFNHVLPLKTYSCTYGCVIWHPFTDKGKFYVDFKNASGCVGEGEPPIDKKPDVTIRLNSDIFVKIFNRKYSTIGP